MKVHFEIVDEKPETHKYWIYIHTTPCGMHYVGVSSQEKTSQRWNPSNYKGTALEPYIERYGWENIEHTVVAYVDSKQLAYMYEGSIIKQFAQQGTLINKQMQCGECCGSDYDQYYKKRIAKPENKIYQRVSGYNQTHTPIETPMEAKQKYLQYGYVPNYIKSDDL